MDIASIPKQHVADFEAGAGVDISGHINHHMHNWQQGHGNGRITVNRIYSMDRRMGGSLSTWIIVIFDTVEGPDVA